MVEEEIQRPVRINVDGNQIVELFGGKLDTFFEYKLDERGRRVGDQPVATYNSLEELKTRIQELKSDR